MADLRDLLGERATPSDPLGITRGQRPSPGKASQSPVDAKLLRLQEIEQMNPVRRFFGGGAERQDILQELPLLLQVENLKRSQGTAEVQAQAEARKAQAQVLDAFRNFTGLLEGTTLKFHALDPETQDKVRPVMEGLFTQGVRMLDLPIDDENIKRSFRIKDFAPLANRLFTKEPLMEDDDKARLSRRLQGAKTDEEAMKAVTDMTGEMEQRAGQLALQGLPKVADAIGATTETPKPFTEAVAAARKLFSGFADSPAFAKAVTAIPADLLSAHGIISPKTSQAAQQKAAETNVSGFSPSQVGLSEKLAGFVQQTDQWKALARQGITIRDFNDNTKVPPDIRQEILSAARKLETAQAKEIVGETGKAGVVAAEQAKADQPLIVTMPDRHVVDRATGQFVDRTIMTRKQLTERGGEKTFAVLDKDETKAYRGIIEARVLMDQYADIAQKLAKAPGANLAQQFDAVTKTFLGIPNIGVELDSLRGSILRIAGTLQGSRVQLSDNDVKAVAGMIPTAADSTGTALQRLGNVMKILDVMKRVALGDVPNSKLHDLVNQTSRPKLKSAEPIR